MGNLSLTRKVGEEIIIGNRQIVIHIVDIDGGRVNFSISADDGFTIARGEIYEKFKSKAKKCDTTVKVHYKNGRRVDKR